MNRLKSLLWILILLVLAGCGRYKNIEVGDLQDYAIKGFDENALIVTLKIPVNNPSIYRITISDLDTRMFVNGQYIGKVFTDQQVVLPSRSEQIHELELRVRLANFLATAGSLMSIRRGDEVVLRLEGTFHARTFLFKKEIEVNESRKVIY